MGCPMSEDYDDDEGPDQGNILREAMEKVDAPNINRRALSELLYTASERSVLGDFRIDPETALDIWRIVELSKDIDSETLATMRM